MLLADLESTSRRIAATSSRSEKLALLASLLLRIDPRAPFEADVAVAFLSGQVRQGRIGLGPAAVVEASKTPPAAEPSLTLADVDAEMIRIASASGPGSAQAKSRILSGLMGRATAPEADLLARLILGELRQGALLGLMAEALARATDIPSAEIRRSVMLAGDLQAVAGAALREGRAGLSRFELTVFQPLQPMLAQAADDLEGALTRLGEAALEYKLDGARVQVHKSGRDVRVFSRRLNDVTSAVPEVVELVSALPIREAILDGEVLALRDDGMPHPFQVTMRRFGRKLDVEALRRELALTPFFFDVVRVDGQDLLDAPASERFAALRAAAPDLCVPRIVTDDPSRAEEFYDHAMEHGHEGVMAKAVDAPYEAGKRGFAWLKVKPAHTLDLVVLAAEWGHGRRKGWLSNIHLGARDLATGAFMMLGKTFKGMTDETLAWQTERFQQLAVATDGYTVHLEPEIVVEVAFSDVQASTHYPAGMALRFARVKRYRPDKAASDADTLEAVRAIHSAQSRGRGEDLPAIKVD